MGGRALWVKDQGVFLYYKVIMLLLFSQRKGQTVGNFPENSFPVLLTVGLTEIAYFPPVQVQSQTPLSFSALDSVLGTGNRIYVTLLPTEGCIHGRAPLLPICPL